MYIIILSILVTGEQEVISVNVSDRVITLDWQPVFAINKHIPAYFEVTIGSAARYGDVVEETFLSTFTLAVPVLTKTFYEMYIVISAVRLLENALYTRPVIPCLSKIF